MHARVRRPARGAGIIDDGGPQWTVAHRVNCARRAGHIAAPVDDEGNETSLTYCGDVDIDGLVYMVHRGPRRRISSIYGESAARFELEESVWVEPVAADEIEHACPWCDDGAAGDAARRGQGRGRRRLLGLGRVLRFGLSLDELQLATLRYDLRRTLDAGRPDARPVRLEV